MDDHPAWFQTRPGPARNAIWYAGGVPQWHKRRALADEDIRVKESAVKKAQIFREELEELQHLEQKKRRLEEVKEVKPVEVKEREVKSPMHRGERETQK